MAGTKLNKKDMAGTRKILWFPPKVVQSEISIHEEYDTRYCSCRGDDGEANTDFIQICMASPVSPASR
jgi:hypothetical protein